MTFTNNRYRYDSLLFSSHGRTNNHLHFQIRLHKLLPRRMLLLWPIIRRPNRHTNKQPHRMNIIPLIHRKPMIYPLWQRHQISLLHMHPHPPIFPIPYIKVSTPVQNVSYFFCVMDMFLKEGFDFFIVAGEVIAVDGDDVGVGVAACVADGGEFGIGGGFGIPWDGFDGVGVIFSIHFPIAFVGFGLGCVFQ